MAQLGEVIVMSWKLQCKWA